ncbi:CRISPR-associated protein, Cas5d family [Thalassoporum mexicanum PCC 7367]|uniref:type I-C CRISPR-associated protein Cas5c n=1 Tax=Thalassoporum mexicanum TaxID=3457544 RepID=UPI00029FA76E|nr:type I-C CRISPR-associated protein Cas5c [Pseudanabaena sp. PCC 7367]AFY70023.1 CRISPR-associated protein, Cas5d family [Pseudanabaena sp. PCC 7367]
METDSSLVVKVWGDFACFTRPEFGAERVSYEVMTPSAARGVLEAIFWKPEFSWQVQEIQVLKPIKRFSILRNEINSWQSDRSAKDPAYHYYADGDRAQRHTLCLREVAYMIKAKINLKPHASAHPAKYRDQFRRRVAKGQCHHQPYLGTREFSAFFSKPEEGDRPIKGSEGNKELGLMLMDLEFAIDSKGAITYLSHDPNGAKAVKGNASPRFFGARLENGVLRVPES